MLSDRDIKKLANGSDVRGVAVAGVADEPVTLTVEAANRIASGFVRFIQSREEKPARDLKIAVGHDSRVSADSIKNAVIDALSANGVTVIDCGLASTPAMFMSIIFAETAVDGSIMITASHLPFNRNGLKFFTKLGGVEHDDVATILEYACKSDEMHDRQGRVDDYDLIGRYSDHLAQKIRKSSGNSETPLKGIKIVVDAGNGSGGFFADKVLKPLGADVIGQFLEPDGTFPNHIPNPENAEAMASIKKAVLDNKADLGFIFDTDVDRMGAVLRSGEEVSRNSLIAMVSAILEPDYPNSTIVTDSVTSDELTDFLEKKLNLNHLRYMRGYRNVINKCIELNAAGIKSPLAIETSGHGALRENYYLDDGAYLAVKLLIAASRLAKEGKHLGDLIADLKHPAEAAEYRFKIIGVDNARVYGSKVLNLFENRALDKGIKVAKPSYEGVRLVFDEGWALLRMSLHDPNMPLNIESHDVGGLKIIVGYVAELLKGFDNLDTSSLNI